MGSGQGCVVCCAHQAPKHKRHYEFRYLAEKPWDIIKTKTTTISTNNNPPSTRRFSGGHWQDWLKLISFPSLRAFRCLPKATLSLAFSLLGGTLSSPSSSCFVVPTIKTKTLKMERNKRIIASPARSIPSARGGGWKSHRNRLRLDDNGLSTPLLKLLARLIRKPPPQNCGDAQWR